MNQNTTSSKPKVNWASGKDYENYVGRWSRSVAHEFLKWLAVPNESTWLDVGCGTGVLSHSILQFENPTSVKGIDRSEAFINFAKEHVQDKRVQFEVGDAEKLNVDSESFDAVLSALMINFIPQPEKAIKEMARVTRTGGLVAAYVWDYADKMQLMRYFWDAAIALDPNAASLAEGLRFPLCQPEPLRQLFEAAKLNHVEVIAIDVPTVFRDFDDYWSPFLGGQGPAPSYVTSLNEERRHELREKIRASLPIASDGTIPLLARAWAVLGKK